MPTNLLWTPQAREDLIDLYLVIDLENIDAAERLYSNIEMAVDMLAHFPRMGPRRPEIAPTARMLVQSSHLILYELHPDTEHGHIEFVEIIRVVDGRRELSRLF